MKTHFCADGTVVRYGGDEFLAFFAGDFDDAKVRDTLQRLPDEFRGLRIGANDDIPLCGSIGAACGIVGKDPFEKLLAEADSALYYVKRNGKNGYKIYHNEMESSIRSYMRVDPKK